MTRQDGGGLPGCALLPAAAVTSYAGGGLDAAAEWSVEVHLPGCPACRAVLAACTDSERLARNRNVLLARAGLPKPGLLGRMLRRCGVGEHVIVVLEATPSLRRSWLTGVLLVLATVVGAAQLAASTYFGGISQASTIDWTGLVPFLLLAPLLPLAAVAAAFSPALDPSYRVASAAPVSKFWLLCVRSVAVVAGTLVPMALAALALPGPWWLAIALLLPALALCSAALSMATVIRPAAAVAGVTAAWLVLVIGLGVTAGRPATVLGPAGQLTAAAVLTAGVALVAVRRSTIDYGWMG